MRPSSDTPSLVTGEIEPLDVSCVSERMANALDSGSCGREARFYEATVTRNELRHPDDLAAIVNRDDEPRVVEPQVPTSAFEWVESESPRIPIMPSAPNLENARRMVGHIITVTGQSTLSGAAPTGQQVHYDALGHIESAERTTQAFLDETQQTLTRNRPSRGRRAPQAFSGTEDEDL